LDRKIQPGIIEAERKRLVFAMINFFMRLVLGLSVLCALTVGGARAAGGLLPRPLMLSFISDMNRQRQVDIYVMDVQRSLYADITRSSEAELQLAWSREGRLAYYSTDADGKISVFVRETDGTTHKLLTSSAVNGGHFPTWADDGRLAFDVIGDGGEYNLYVLETDGRLHPASTNTQPAFGPAWSPDGTLAFVSPTKEGQHVFLLKSSGELTEAAPDLAQSMAPRWTANGELTFTSGTGELLKRHLDGTLQTLVMSGKDFGTNDATWSADGRMAFTARVSTGDVQIGILGQDGKMRIQSNPAMFGTALFPTWSSNGWLAYVFSLKGFQIYIISPDGQSRAVTPKSAFSINPAWLP
jgi:Tol biopolymer transport system component